MTALLFYGLWAYSPTSCQHRGQSQLEFIYCHKCQLNALPHCLLPLGSQVNYPPTLPQLNTHSA